MKLTKQQAIDIFCESGDTVEGKDAKLVDSQGSEEHRWYVKKQIVFSLDCALFMYELNFPNNENNSFDDVNDGEQFECVEVVETTKTIKFYKAKA